MENKVLGIHHITAIAGNAKRNFEFYTKVLGLRLVKKTVNFDDPGTYHLYYGDEVGSPGTILTFFPWEGITKGKIGTGMATEIAYSVPDKSIDFWIERFKENNVKILETGDRFHEKYISFEDPDGLHLSIVIPVKNDGRKPWATPEVSDAVAIRGFHSISLTLKNIKATADILTDIFEYKLTGEEGNRFRYTTDAVDNASIIDLIQTPDGTSAVNAGGTIHHIAFRVKDEKTLMAFREKITKKGFGITPKIDRNYFFSLYFREPGGVLFELATDNPGFAVDEPVNELGSNLKLPAQYENNRTEIENVLPALV
jgi:glyoxalase family protein